MMLCLDVGNSQIYGGVFKGDQLALQFRRSSKGSFSSDEVGIFLRDVLRENNIDPKEVKRISICTVVPGMLHSLRGACRKYFGLTPFVLQAGTKTGLKINYRNPLELGSDRIANCIAASHMFPNQNFIVVDMGTATTFCAVNKSREFLGGAIIPGINISMNALETNTAKLPTVEIIPCQQVLGRSTVEGIQAGLYFGAIGAVKEIAKRLSQEAFLNETAILIGTGGFTRLLEGQNIFDHEVSDLILKGLYLAFLMNERPEGRGHAATTIEM